MDPVPAAGLMLLDPALRMAVVESTVRPFAESWTEKSFELQVMGTFEVVDGQINAWRDYFDMHQFTSQMG